MSDAPRQVTFGHRTVVVDDRQGLLSVAHCGDLTWDELFAIKNEIWGDNARAIEVYPAKIDLVNAGNYRHLWRLGENDFCPDLLGSDRASDSLQSRCSVAWAEARQ